MTRKFLRAGVLAVAAAALALAGCNPPVDYGTPCRLTRPAYPDGGGVSYVPANDPSIDPGFDFLANGDPDCEDLVCLRQAHKDYSALDADGGVAFGECSTPCLESSDCGDPAKGLQCSQLAFDQSFLEQLQATDPATYAEYFGDSTSALYCTDPGLPDLSSGT